MSIPSPSSSEARIRLQRDIDEYQREFQSAEGPVLEFDDFQVIRGEIIVNEKESPYYGGCFVVKAVIPDNYPFEAPIIRFHTKIWHPNIDPECGFVYSESLSSEWSPCYSIANVFRAIQMWIEYPDADAPLNVQVGKQFTESPDVFKRTARFWTLKYASESEGSIDEEFERKIRSHTRRTGFEEDYVVLNLSLRRWEVEEEPEEPPLESPSSSGTKQEEEGEEREKAFEEERP